MLGPRCLTHLPGSSRTSRADPFYQHTYHCLESNKEKRNTNLITDTHALRVGTVIAAHAPRGSARDIPFSRPMSVESVTRSDKSAFVSLVNDQGEHQTMSVSLDHRFEVLSN